jgi:hypothetical protein
MVKVKVKAIKVPDSQIETIMSRIANLQTDYDLLMNSVWKSTSPEFEDFPNALTCIGEFKAAQNQLQTQMQIIKMYVISESVDEEEIEVTYS